MEQEFSEFRESDKSHNLIITCLAGTVVAS